LDNKSLRMPVGVYVRKVLPLYDRFWSKVKIGEVNDCWEWTASKDRKGYGELKVEGKTAKAHRISFSLILEDPKDKQVCHTCDNPSCVNPNHLFLGTNTDNQKDKVAKGRQAKGPEHGLRGEKHQNSKLTNQQVREIRQKLLDGISGASLAKKYSVTKTTISSIKNNKTYRNV